ncbi:MAG TPA: hypothetical protein VK509_23895 [Polyangiales bacterium]|nr:hypothetical protein [Polyangiales bacterium]
MSARCTHRRARAFMALATLGASALIACSDGADDGAPNGTPSPAAGSGGSSSSQPAADGGPDDSGTPTPVPDAARDAGRVEPDPPDGGTVDRCPTQCERDALRCTGTRIERCSVDADGCSRFARERDCSDDAQECVQSDDDASCAPPAPRCDDGALNGDESDRDCGGTTCTPCALDAACARDEDCASDVCWTGRCASAPLQCSDAFAAPDDFLGPAKLTWPLRSKTSAVVRQALGSSFGEFQQYGTSTLPYVHSGIDIRGLQGDYVRVVADGNIWLTANLATCADGGGSACRLYVKGAGGRYIHYYSHLRLSDADPLSTELRAAIMNATAKGAGSYAVQAGTAVSAGQTLSAIADFAADQWAHVHFNLFDAQQSYDGINPLSALVDAEGEHPLIDDEPPFVSALEVRPDEMSASRIPLAHCAELSGAVDLIATMGDSFATSDPAPEAVPGPINSIGVYGARTLIRSLASGEVRELPWYEFSRAPFDCAGPLRGAQCPVQLTEADFVAHTIDTPEGAPHLAEPYTAVLFDAPGSSSDYLGVENYRHVMTHGWGQPGSWDTRDFPDGLYQVSVEARDHAGNRAARSELVAIDNAGTLDPAALAGDAIVRDHGGDSGAVPSTLGLAPSWASPDILVVSQGSAVAVDALASDAPLIAGQSYDIYLRVHNTGCGPLAGIRARLSSLPPALDGTRSGALAITDAGSFSGDASHPSGLTLAAGARGLLGPFAYTPSAAELEGFGARALLAELDAADDPRRTGAEQDDVAADNNAAVRSVQLRSTAGNVAPAASFQLGNPGPGGACVQLVLELVDVAVGDPATLALVRLPYDARLASAWTAVPGALIEHDAAGGTTTIRMQRKRVALPPLGLPAATALRGEVMFAKPAAASTGTLRVREYREGRLTGGVDVR